MSSPAMMPKKLSPQLTKLKEEEIRASRVNVHDTIEFIEKKERRDKEVRTTKKIAQGLGCSPLKDEVHTQGNLQKRAAKKRQAIARINRKRRPKKR